jgi:protein PhnA
MSILENAVKERSNGKCELCSSDKSLRIYQIPPVETESEDTAVYICETCESQINGSASDLDKNHWYCLSDSMWSEHVPVQVMAFRILTLLKSELVDQMYLDDVTLSWAKKGIPSDSSDQAPTKDSNGTVLSQGDTVTLIKDLNVKGAGFTAKRGTVVKNINLTDDPRYIEGKVNGTQIVLVADYLKKA